MLRENFELEKNCQGVDGKNAEEGEKDTQILVNHCI